MYQDIVAYHRQIPLPSCEGDTTAMPSPLHGHRPAGLCTAVRPCHNPRAIRSRRYGSKIGRATETALMDLLISAWGRQRQEKQHIVEPGLEPRQPVEQTPGDGDAEAPAWPGRSPLELPLGTRIITLEPDGTLGSIGNDRLDEGLA